MSKAELDSLAEVGEQAGLPIGPAAVRALARRRQVRRRALAGVAAALLVVAGSLAAVGALGSSGAQHLHTIAPIQPAQPTTTVFADHPPATFFSLTFVNTRAGFALTGDPRRLVATRDGGRTWQEVGAAQGWAPGTRITFATDLVGWAWHAHGVLATVDGGRSWQLIAFPHEVFDLQLGPLTGTDTPTGFRMPTATVLVGCADGSCPESVWTIVGSTASLVNPLTYRGRSGSLADPRTGGPVWVASSGSDAGPQLAWVDAAPHNVATLLDPCPPGATDTQLLAHTAAASGLDVWLVCAGRPADGGWSQAKEVFHSSDGGQQHWTLTASTGFGHDIGLYPAGRVAGLVAEGEGVAWLALDRVDVRVTADAGRTWGPAFPVPSGRSPVDVTALPGTTEAWALAGTTDVWHTADGVHWTKL